MSDSGVQMYQLQQNYLFVMSHNNHLFIIYLYYSAKILFSGLLLAIGHKWHETAWKKPTRKSSADTFKKKYIMRKEHSRIRQLSSIRKRLFAPREKTHPNRHYGPAACDPIDIDKSITCASSISVAEFQVTRKHCFD